MTDWPIREAWSGGELSLRSPVAWGRDLAVAALIGSWIGALGPFGNYTVGRLDVRIAYHIVQALICVGAFGVTVRLALRGGRRLGISPWVAAPASAAATCLPLSAVAAWVGVAFFPQLKHLVSPVEWCAETLILVVPIVCGYAGLLHLLSRRPWAAPARTVPVSDYAPGAPVRPRLADRLPAAAGGDILALKVEDHYVRIYTAAGSHLLLMRLSDAIAEMDGVDGLKTHRSWWVARRAVGDIRLGGRGGCVTLRNGVQAPVARSALASVRAAGWS